jgi:hypothetical protein
MEIFSYFGLLAFILVIIHMSLPDEVTNLKNRIKKLETKNKAREPKGESILSNILKSIIGKKCKIHEHDDFPGNMSRIIELDEEWVKVVEYDKKGKENHRIIRIDLIESISEIED